MNPVVERGEICNVKASSVTFDRLSTVDCEALNASEVQRSLSVIPPLHGQYSSDLVGQEVIKSETTVSAVAEGSICPTRAQSCGRGVPRDIILVCRREDSSKCQIGPML